MKTLAFYLLASLFVGPALAADQCSQARKKVYLCCLRGFCGGSGSKADQAIQNMDQNFNDGSTQGSDLSNPGAGVNGTCDQASQLNSNVAQSSKSKVSECTKLIDSANKTACQADPISDDDKKDLLNQAQSAGQGAQANQACKNNAGGGGGAPQMPQMPQNKDDQKQQQQPQQLEALKAPDSTAPDCTNPVAALSDACKGKNQASAADSNNKPTPADFFSGAGGGGGAHSGAGVNSLGSNTPDGFKPANVEPAGTPKIGGASGGFAVGGTTANGKENNGGQGGGDPLGKLTDVLNGERSGGFSNSGGGGAEGGGFAGYGNAQTASKDRLEDYLPGRRLDPHRRAPAQANKHPDIASPYEDIWQRLSKRYRIICAMKRLRGCD